VTDLALSLEFLTQQSRESVIHIFWYTLIFDLPRYGLAFCAEALSGLRKRDPASAIAVKRPTVSVTVAGHNEADSIERCVRSLREQSLNDFQLVIVSDGSTDGTGAVMSRLVREGLADCALSTELRGGKSAGVNLAFRYCTGDILINVDCDCSFDRYAIERTVAMFSDPTLGAVCGDIQPRNGDASLTARFQEIEYMMTIAVGKRAAASIEQVVCASGAFGAFRRVAVDQVNGLDVGGGEDLDLTIRLRKMGWRIGFAADAVCYTDVPTVLWTFVRQRLRWERDAIWIRYRKHFNLMTGGRGFRPAEAFHQWDFFAYSVLATAIFPFYILWLFASFGAFAVPVLVAMQLGLFLLDMTTLALADVILRRGAFARNIVYLFGYSVFNAYFMRIVRLIAYVQEWCFRGSRGDNYVPLKVRLIRHW
jgi:cellulose synthase/poly-beta-1,6-N-acetylglucosamine synthase-like glycosyltransferase